MAGGRLKIDAAAGANNADALATPDGVTNLDIGHNAARNEAGRERRRRAAFLASVTMLCRWLGRRLGGRGVLVASRGMNDVIDPARDGRPGDVDIKGERKMETRVRTSVPRLSSGGGGHGLDADHDAVRRSDDKAVALRGRFR